MIENIKDKLRKELNKEITEESQVIYILTCIRKILDHDSDLRSKYKKLLLYCNWSLHIEITRGSKVLEDLSPHFKQAIAQNSQAIGNIAFRVLFSHFVKEFFSLLKDLELPKSWYENQEKQRQFNIILFTILEDTPLILTQSEQIELRITNIGKGNEWGQVGWNAVMKK